ncbi:MAG: hypothetical protein ACREHC_05735 [Candidatus Levyibacteriota bacterium]
MRKFVIKNRRKRKYTKKTEQNSSLSFTKSFYGMLPLFIMFIVFMAMFVITSPLRNPLISVQFSFDISAISLQNPLNFLAVCGSLIVYGYTMVINGFMTAGSTLWYAIQTTTNAIMLSVQLLNPQPLLILINQAFTSFTLFITSIFIFCYQSVVGSLAVTSQVMQEAAKSTGNSLVWFFHGVSTITTSWWRNVIWGVVMLAKSSTLVCVTIYHFLVSVIHAILFWIWSVLIAFASWVKYVVNIVLTFIEWPFKIISAYLLHYKPVSDALGKHMGRALNDMGVCFANLGKSMSSSDAKN